MVNELEVQQLTKRVSGLSQELAAIKQRMGNHLGTKPGASTLDNPHTNIFPVVEDVTRIAATAENEFALAAERAVPGTSAAKIYICLADSSSPLGYSWTSITSAPSGEAFFPVGFTDATLIGTDGWSRHSVAAIEEVDIVGYVPLNAVTITDIDLVMIPDATETITLDVIARNAAVGQNRIEHNATLNNVTLAVTALELTEMDISAGYADIAAGDYFSAEVRSDTDEIQVLGIKIRFTR